MRALYNILRVIFGVKSCKKRFFIFVAVKYFPERVMATIFVACGDSLRGSAGQRSMRESNRCDGVQCAHQFFENARPHRVARTRSCSFSLSCFLCPQFLLVRVFSPKISVVVVVILVIVVGVFDHSAVQTAVVVVF